MSQSKRVLVTGSAGRLGRAVVRELTARGHHVIGFDRVPDRNTIVGSIQDPELLGRAVDGVDCLIHLAATADDARFPRGEPPDDGDNFLSDLVPNNVVGVYHVLEAARKRKVPRVVLASTGQVIDGHLREGNVPVTVGVVPRPRYLYACTKVFLESIGQVYARHHGIAVLAVRLGWCPRQGQVEELRGNKLGQDVYLSPGDAGRFFAAAVEADSLPGYTLVYATSRHTHQLRYDLDQTRKLIGYEPRDRWPDGAEEFD
ncbi:MAG TPA: NAD(P)-dependent oxidoreductase [Fimbriiglobus sp.]|nr:NAD(P)-dependent oxidoreductase [Fimbriiglobus sp.]